MSIVRLEPIATIGPTMKQTENGSYVLYGDHLEALSHAEARAKRLEDALERAEKLAERWSAISWGAFENPGPQLQRALKEPK